MKFRSKFTVAKISRKVGVLRSAVEGNDAARVRKLLADEEVQSSISPQLTYYLLRVAVQNKNKELVRLFLARKPNLNLKIKSRPNLMSPLWIAVMHGSMEIAELLIRAGADVNERLGPHPLYDQRFTLLHLLSVHYCCSCNDRLISVLIEHGANVNARDSYGESVLYYAIRFGRIRLVEMLLESGAMPNDTTQQGDPMLHVAVTTSHAPRLVPLLLRYGADLTWRDRRGGSVLHHVAESFKGSRAVARLLIRRGAPVDAEERIHKQTPLHIAAVKGKEELVKLFLEHGADVNARTKSGMVPLYLGSRSGNPSVIRLLVNYGANIHERTDNGCTPLHAACGHSRDENIRLLLEFGADITVKDKEGNTPFSLVEYKTLHPSTKTILKYLAKSKPANPLIDAHDFEMIKQHQTLLSFYEACSTEISIMRQKKIYNHMGYDCILTKTRSQLTSLLRNADFVDAYSASDIREYFSIYAEDLQRTFEEAERRKNFLVAVEEPINSAFHQHLPILVIKKIAHFASHEELFFM